MGKFRYQHITSSVKDKVPQSDFLYTGEIAVNIYPGFEKLYFKNASGDVVSVLTEEQVLDNDYFIDAEYDSSAKAIYFYNSADEVVASIDATDFIKDGMVDSVEIKTVGGETVLAITFNEASGKEEIDIPLSSIFNPDNYYTKDEVDELLDEKLDESAYTEVWVHGSGTNSAVLKGSVDCDAEEYSIAVGVGSSAKTNTSIAIGQYCVASGQVAVSIGGGNNAYGDGAVSIGWGSNTASGTSAIVLGAGNRAEGDEAIAIGGGNVTEGQCSLALGAGNNVKGNDSVAIGGGNKVEGEGASAIGIALNTSNPSEHTVGQYNKTYSGNVEFGVDENTLFSVGNGFNDYGSITRHNAFEIRQNGDIYIVDPTDNGNYYQKQLIKLDPASRAQVDEMEVVTAAALADLDNRKVSKAELEEVEATTAAALNDLDNRKVGKAELDEVELVTAAALADLDNRKLGKEEFNEAEAIIAASLNDLDTKKVGKSELDEVELVIAGSLNDLNTRIEYAATGLTTDDSYTISLMSSDEYHPLSQISLYDWFSDYASTGDIITGISASDGYLYLDKNDSERYVSVEISSLGILKTSDAVSSASTSERSIVFYDGNENDLFSVDLSSWFDNIPDVNSVPNGLGATSVSDGYILSLQRDGINIDSINLGDWFDTTDSVTQGDYTPITSNAVYDWTDGVKLKKITQSDYDALVQAGTVDPNTLYIITD